jgi:LPXTG-motif cell wall-anchored protein
MKVKSLVGSFIAAGVVLAGATAASAGGEGFAPPDLVVTPDQGQPGFEFTMAVEPCPGGYDLEFVVPGDTDTASCPTNGFAAFQTSKTFMAPVTPGTYDVYVVLQYGLVPASFVMQDNGALPVDCLDVQFDADVCALYGEITVLEPEATTTTTVVDETTTTVVETTTTVVDETTTTLDDSGVPVPTTAPTGTLPATGNSGSSVPVSMALVVLLAGIAMIAVTRARRNA